MALANIVSSPSHEHERPPIDASIDTLSEKVAIQLEKSATLQLVRVRKDKSGLRNSATDLRDMSAIIKSVIHKAMHNALAGNSVRSHQLRLDLLETLVRYERLLDDTSVRKPARARVELQACTEHMQDDPLLSTAEAGKILGFSRMYVTMLVDAEKLPAASISAGGHRRIRKSDVLKYRDEFSAKPKGTSDYKAVAQEAGMYGVDEKMYVDLVSRPVAKKAHAKRSNKSTAK